jgi:hypothetical protein
MPSDAELEKLARILESRRNQYLAEHELPILPSQEKAKSALAILDKRVREMERTHREFADAAEREAAPPVARRMLTERLTAIRKVRSMIAGIEASSVWNYWGVGSDGWR